MPQGVVERLIRDEQPRACRAPSRDLHWSAPRL